LGAPPLALRPRREEEEPGAVRGDVVAHHLPRPIARLEDGGAELPEAGLRLLGRLEARDVHEIVGEAQPVAEARPLASGELAQIPKPLGARGDAALREIADEPLDDRRRRLLALRGGRRARDEHRQPGQPPTHRARPHTILAPRAEEPFPQVQGSAPVARFGWRLLAPITMREARDLAQLRVEAEDIARKAGQTPTTAHVLLAIFTVPCPARTLLSERGVDEMRVLAALPGAPDEPETLLDELFARAREIASGLGVPADSLHLLIAISRSPETLAHALLTTCAVPLSSLRNTVLSWYTSGRIPRQYVQKQAPLEPAVIDRGPAPRARKAIAEPRPEAPPPPPVREERKPQTTYSRFTPPPPRDAVAEHGEKAAPFLFDPLAYPNLSALTTNLTEAAAKGKFDPLIGREREVEAAVDVLGKRRGNNPVLVGPPG